MRFIRHGAAAAAVVIDEINYAQGKGTERRDASVSNKVPVETRLL